MPPSTGYGLRKRCGPLAPLGDKVASAALVATVPLAGLLIAAAPHAALAACTPAGPAIASGTSGSQNVVTCSPAAVQTGRIGNGPNGAPGYGNYVTVNVSNGATINTNNTNAISLGNNAVITVGSSGGGSTATVTNYSSSGGGEYGDGNNTVDINANSLITVYSNGVIQATGPQINSEAINPYGPGNTILNYGLIKAGASSAIFFQNVNTTSASPRNRVDNYGIVDATGGTNPTTGGEAIGSYQNVGIDIINESGASIKGNLDLQGGNDSVTLEPHSVITGSLDGGAGTNTLTLDTLAASDSDSIQGVVKNFQTLNKTGPGTWTLTGSVGQSSGAPLAVAVQEGTLVLTGYNANFNGNVTIDSGATLEARAQSLPPVINDLHGDLLINQVSPDGIQPNDGTYSGMIDGTGVVTKIGVGTVTLTGANTYSGGTYINQGAIAAGANSAFGAPTSGITFNGGTLQLTQSFNLSPLRPITINDAAAAGGYAGGGTIDANGFQTTISQGITGAGGLTVASTNPGGIVTLAGANTYAGGTTINSNATLQLGNGGTTGSIVGNVTDNGALTFNRSDTVLFPGLISGSGGITQAGTGTTILTQDQTFTGTTLISQGTLQLGNGGGTAGSVIGPIVDNAALVVNRADQMTLPGAISGTGSLTQAGTGYTILTGENTYSGGTTITNGTLQIGNGGTTGGIVGNVVDEARLSFNRSDTSTFSGNVSGSGELANYGPGTTILTGTNTYTGGTRVRLRRDPDRRRGDLGQHRRRRLADERHADLQPIRRRHLPRTDIGRGRQRRSGGQRHDDPHRQRKLYRRHHNIGRHAATRQWRNERLDFKRRRRRQRHAGLQPQRHRDRTLSHLGIGKHRSGRNRHDDPDGEQRLHRNDHDQRRHAPTRQRRNVGPGRGRRRRRCSARLRPQRRQCLRRAHQRDGVRHPSGHGHDDPDRRQHLHGRHHDLGRRASTGQWRNVGLNRRQRAEQRRARFRPLRHDHLPRPDFRDRRPEPDRDGDDDPHRHQHLCRTYLRRERRAGDRRSLARLGGARRRRPGDDRLRRDFRRLWERRGRRDQRRNRRGRQRP